MEKPNNVNGSDCNSTLSKKLKLEEAQKQEDSFLIPTKPKILNFNEKKKFRCQKCNLSFSTRIRLHRHKQKQHQIHNLTDFLSLIGESNEESMKKINRYPSKREKESIKHEQTQTKVEPCHLRQKFISVEDFNRYAQKQATKWSDIHRDCIYKLQWANRVDQQITGNLINRDGVISTVLLPRLVIDNLLSITEKDVDIYLRPNGIDQADIAVIKKNICKKCDKELFSHNYLKRHLKTCKDVDKGQ